MNIRDYDAARDKEATHRIWREVGWLDSSPEHAALLDEMLASGRAMVAELDGAAESMVLTVRGTLRYLDEDLPLCAVADVTTSHVARRRGLATRVTALSLARDAAQGDILAGLGAFEQGYYDRLGFGTGSYEHHVTFDPMQLKVSGRPRTPRRLTPDDWEAVHAARLTRLRRHGAVSLLPPAGTRIEMHHRGHSFGLGYSDGPNGALSHYSWCQTENMEYGPYFLHWMAYRNREEFLELMSLVKSLGDQVRLVDMVEPPGVQMQALLETPFRHREATARSPYAVTTRAEAGWQMRILDPPACLEHTHLAGPELRFNLRLTDPIERYLEPGLPWRGAAGDWVVSLGRSSGAGPGRDDTLPTLTASVNAFTRLWLGVGPASGLAMTDDLAGPPDLLAQLDATLRLPQPHPDWDF